jgi:hypothetical protein
MLACGVSLSGLSPSSAMNFRGLLTTSFSHGHESRGNPFASRGPWPPVYFLRHSVPVWRLQTSTGSQRILKELAYARMGASVLVEMYRSHGRFPMESRIHWQAALSRGQCHHGFSRRWVSPCCSSCPLFCVASSRTVSHLVLGVEDDHMCVRIHFHTYIDVISVIYQKTMQ